jgi:hypothetical protein
MNGGITFQFKDTSEAGIFYAASYFGDDTLLVEKRKDDSTISGLRIPKIVKLDSVDDPWRAFYENATFNNILQALILPTRYKEESDDWFWTYKFFMAKKKDGTETVACALDDETFLKGIADNPWRLSDPRAIDRLRRILRDAKTGGTTSRKEAKKMLSNLMPRHKGGEKYRPQGMELARTLLKRLAGHLSEKCIKFLKDKELWEDRSDSLTGEVWIENFEQLSQWGKTNEDRISKLNKKRLNELIKKPAHYADSLLEETLQIALRTINTPSSAK